MTGASSAGELTLAEPVNHRGVWRGSVDAVPAIIKLAADGAPWHDPRSAFFGGAGLVPPFRPLVLHEAEAWARVDPDRLLAAGEARGVPFVALRPMPGVRPSPGGITDVEPLLRATARALELLHRAGVAHRDLRPSNLLADGEVIHILDLDVSLVGGLGPLGVGSRRWRAPELAEQAGGVRSDLYALGRLARWTLGLEPAAPLPTDCPHRALIESLLDPRPGNRPADIVEVRAALGEATSPIEQSGALHPALTPDCDRIAVEAALLDGDPWRIIESLDAAPFDRWAMAATTGRLLAEAARAGGEQWLLVGAACGLLAERSGGEMAGAYDAQAREARHRSAEPWHPTWSALGRLLDDEGDRDRRIDDLCRLRRFATAAARARRDPIRSARVAWFRRDTPALMRALRAADRADPRAWQLAAAEAIRRGGSEGIGSGHSLGPECLLDIARECSSTSASALLRVADDSGPAASRARLTLALSRGNWCDARALACRLADAGSFDPTVAATIVVFDEPGPRRVMAERIVSARLPDLDRALRLADDRLTVMPDDQGALALKAAAHRAGSDKNSTDPLAIVLRRLLGWVEAGDEQIDASTPSES